MFRTLLKSKIHRATVTQADLHYIGSMTLDRDLMDAADLMANELVHIVDINNGSRLETYVIEGERGTGMVKINGAAARLVRAGDLVIVLGYGIVSEQEAQDHLPRVVFVDEHNRIAEESNDPATANGLGVIGDLVG